MRHVRIRDREHDPRAPDTRMPQHVGQVTDVGLVVHTVIGDEAESPARVEIGADELIQPGEIAVAELVARRSRVLDRVGERDVEQLDLKTVRERETELERVVRAVPVVDLRFRPADERSDCPLDTGKRLTSGCSADTHGTPPAASSRRSFSLVVTASTRTPAAPKVA